MRGLLRLIVMLSVSLALPGAAGAVSLEPVGAFDSPTSVAADPGDPNRLFVAEREGVVRTAEAGRTAVFVDLTSLVSCCERERGLLSIAAAPNFADSGLLYAVYTGETAAGGVEGDVHVDAFTAREGDGDFGDREEILSIGHSVNGNHNGDLLLFGPDGHLYISVGDGGGGGDPFNSGQSLSTLLGKVLRIDPRPGESPPYAIPPGNPFAGPDGALDEIWAYGLRNPWRFSFDRESDDLVIADVGQREREEVNFAPSPKEGVVGGGGANYGWDCREGLIAYSGPPDAPSPACAEASGFVEPVFDYPHGDDPEDGRAYGCSIIGGHVVRDASLGDLYGRYLYGDLCVGQVRSIDLAAVDPAADDRAEGGLSAPAFALWSFGEDSCGRIYLAAGDEVLRLEGEAPRDCLSPPPSDPDPAPGAKSSSEALPASPMIDPAKSQRFRLRLRAARRRVGVGRRARLTVVATPCERGAHGQVLLRRGGRQPVRKRLGHDCRARFHPRVRRRSTFRAFLPGAAPGGPARSRRLTIVVF